MLSTRSFDGDLATFLRGRGAVRPGRDQYDHVFGSDDAVEDLHDRAQHQRACEATFVIRSARSQVA